MTKKPLTIAELARMGGLARKDKLSAERRREIALKAGRAAAKVHKAKAAKRKKENQQRIYTPLPTAGEKR